MQTCGMTLSKNVLPLSVMSLLDPILEECCGCTTIMPRHPLIWPRELGIVPNQKNKKHNQHPHNNAKNQKNRTGCFHPTNWSNTIYGPSRGRDDAGPIVFVDCQPPLSHEKMPILEERELWFLTEKSSVSWATAARIIVMWCSRRVSVVPSLHESVSVSFYIILHLCSHALAQYWFPCPHHSPSRSSCHLVSSCGCTILKDASKSTLFLFRAFHGSLMAPKSTMFEIWSLSSMDLTTVLETSLGALFPSTVTVISILGHPTV